jgi:hypothetical protein
MSLKLLQRQLQTAALEGQHRPSPGADLDILIRLRVRLVEGGSIQTVPTKRGCSCGSQAEHLPAAHGMQIHWKGQFDHLAIAGLSVGIAGPNRSVSGDRPDTQAFSPKPNARAPLLL